jgi:hypothetical protein
MKKLSILLFSFLSVACASNGYNPSYVFNQLQVVNLTESTITDVNLQIGGSDRSVSCDEVAKNAICNKNFGKRRYPQQVDELSWTDASGTPRSQQVSQKFAAYYDVALAFRLVIEIHEDGSVKPIVEQDGSLN